MFHALRTSRRETGKNGNIKGKGRTMGPTASNRVKLETCAARRIYVARVPLGTVRRFVNTLYTTLREIPFPSALRILINTRPDRCAASPRARGAARCIASRVLTLLLFGKGIRSRSSGEIGGKNVCKHIKFFWDRGGYPT